MPEDDVRQRHALRKGLTVAAAWGAVVAVGAVLSRRLAKGDEGSPELRTAAICWGQDLQLHSAALRSLEAVAVMGGIELDLTGATPDAGGATLDVLAVMGGVDITVPDTWAVEVEQSAVAGGVEVRVPDAADLPPDSPRLTVRVRAYLGGVQVSATPA